MDKLNEEQRKTVEQLNRVIKELNKEIRRAKALLKKLDAPD